MRFESMILKAVVLGGVLLIAACAPGPSPPGEPQPAAEKPTPPTDEAKPSEQAVVMPKEAAAQPRESPRGTEAGERLQTVPEANLSVDSAAEKPAGPAVGALEADKPFEELRRRAEDPAYLLADLKKSTDAVVLGTAIGNEVFEREEVGPTMNRTLIEVAETLHGEMGDRFELFWSVTSESIPLEVGKTYLLFVATTADGETWCVAGRHAAIEVEDRELQLGAKRLAVDEVASILTVED